jgi:transcriptional regulator with XRE-family HTH domain
MHSEQSGHGPSPLPVRISKKPMVPGLAVAQECAAGCAALLAPVALMSSPQVAAEIARAGITRSAAPAWPPPTGTSRYGQRVGWRTRMSVHLPDTTRLRDLWDRPELRAALRNRDIARVFTAAKSCGLSQRDIGRLTGQSQSEITRIVGGRKVVTIGLLERISDGLDIPRGYLGIAYTEEGDVDHTVPPSSSREDVSMRRRNFLGTAFGIVVLGKTLSSADLLDLATIAPTPPPAVIRDEHIVQLRQVTTMLRGHDATHGAGACRDAILAHAEGARALLRSEASESLRRAVLSAVAEAETLAGWAEHDLGNADAALAQLTRALSHTREAGDHAHSAVVLHHLSRVPLDNGTPEDALEYIKLGLGEADESDDLAVAALLRSDQAMAYAHLGPERAGQALTALRRAEDEFGHALDRDVPACDQLGFFDASTLSTVSARVFSALGVHDARYRAASIEQLQRALKGASAERVRQATFNTSWLGAHLLAEGDLTGGVHYGRAAVEMVGKLRSPRLITHLEPLRTAAQAHVGHDDVDALVRSMRKVAA